MKVSLYYNKLLADGCPTETTSSISLMRTASIEGGIILCLTQRASEPLRVLSNVLPNLLKGF
ncbi:LmrA/YxaF family transcription factor [Bacillus testis]|uniref:LmrA/YxaF family transcription factor n=1 Tax=Bacillus testis TaxID=1622072 RepID=UPI0036F438F0